MSAPAGLEPSTLPDRVRVFVRDSHARKYYRDFEVNSRNYMHIVPETKAWLSLVRSLVEECAAHRAGLEPPLRRELLGSLLDMLHLVDDGDCRIVFIADEAGSYMAGIEWAEVLPVWFETLARTCEDEAEFRAEAKKAARLNYPATETMIALADETWRRIRTPNHGSGP